MSGGRFDYSQYHISSIADSIQSELDRQGQIKPKDELWHDEVYGEEKYYTHPEEVQKEMRTAIIILRKAAIYAQRIDWYLSGDDGEESFLKRLRNELNVKECDARKVEPNY